jgi:hypothetical protein
MRRKAKDPTIDPPKPVEPQLVVQQREDESTDRAIARTMLQPSVNSARTLFRVNERRNTGAPQLTLMDLIDELSAQCTEVSKGNLNRPEAILTAQAHTLESLFQDLAELAYNNLHNFDVAERLFRLAFRAQSQSRATIETLGNIKNPPMVFAKQANVTTGPQQVNNGAARAQETENQPNKLLEQSDAERLDFGAKGATGAPDTALETVGAVNRTENNGGERHGGP